MAVVVLDSVSKINKSYYLQILVEQCKYSVNSSSSSSDDDDDDNDDDESIEIGPD